MLKLAWNSLRSGDHVLVHDATDPRMPLVRGLVVFVDVLRGTNDVAIRVTRDDTTTVVLHPARLAVHPDPLDGSDRCWRCGRGGDEPHG